jgi:hypothetical protein
MERSDADRWPACGPVQSMTFRVAGDGAATGQPDSARRAVEAVFAALRLPCAARARGPVAQLAVLTAFAALGRARRVRSRSALRARAPTPVLLGASHARRALPGCPVADTVVVGGASHTPLVACRLARADAGTKKQTRANKCKGPGTVIKIEPILISRDSLALPLPDPRCQRKADRRQQCLQHCERRGGVALSARRERGGRRR